MSFEEPRDEDKKKELLAKVDMLAHCCSVGAAVFLAGALGLALPHGNRKSSAAEEARVQELLRRLQEEDEARNRKAYDDEARELAAVEARFGCSFH